MTDDRIDDTGAIDPALAAALAGGDPATIRTALLEARLLVPIVAIGADSAEAEMAVPTLVGADGRRALPVFSSYDALRAWQPGARPVPMPGRQAVAAAIDEGCAAVVLDVAGPIPHTVGIRSAGVEDHR
jgi:hypothetical protein